ncbi:MAG: L,D-transpeptidase [Bacteroidia bacterium]|nr:L,D-transpeptidase [Bacteroidia bacterium]NNF30811.1 L,D-transpeptidase [Flavobacteriaceae bacterium]NNK55619.1 L,D-transpeptidase [Flavobacteriaceae bacterium]NNM08293.1 L,D-transpeptidase [Flavobacteriaceae bacterium]
MKILLTIIISLFVLQSYAQVHKLSSLKKTDTVEKVGTLDSLPVWVHVDRPVPIKKYFHYLDSLVSRYDSLVSYPVTEHLLVHANPWIIDSLVNTDYYRLIERDSFVYDQKEIVILKTGDSIVIPDVESANSILKDFKSTWIDVNIPEYRLRIFRDSVEMYTVPIRVGQNRKKFLAMGGRVTDLRTKTGIGKIIRHERDPDFYNPTNGRRFYLTRRDDDSVTVMPQIPWIETEINGVRNGQLIHPTTNPETLNKPYSNGCIGTTEGDAWIIYYYAPLKTAIHIRYELSVLDYKGEAIELKDIYGFKE